MSDDGLTFEQTDVLELTGLDRDTLQTWVNRGHAPLFRRHPGRGRPRSYSTSDVVRLAIMWRANDLGLPLFVAKDIAESVTTDYASSDSVPRDLCLYLDWDSIDLAMATVSALRLYRYRWSSEPFDQIPLSKVLGGFTNGERARREAQLLSVPVLVFPVGRIVQKTMQAIDAIVKTRREGGASLQDRE